MKQLKCQIDIENSNSKKNKMPEFIELSDEIKDKKRKNINQVYYLLKLKPSCNKIQKCAQIILLHDEFYTLLLW